MGVSTGRVGSVGGLRPCAKVFEASEVLEVASGDKDLRGRSHG
jgi:hypothetical protein